MRRGARRGHLVEAGHLAELLLQRRRDGGGDDLRARAGIEGLHLDGGIGDFRQGRQRQLEERDETHHQDRDHQQRGGDRAEDEQA